MSQPLKAVPVADRVHWVGAIDWGIREFHGYATSRGTTYNAFLVTGERPILIDTVKAPFREEMMSRIASVVDPREIEVIVSNHSEMDHSGCLADVIEAVGPDEVYASKKGVEALEAHFGLGERVEAVEDGETLRVGDMTLTCAETKMLHWPDSMVTYLAEAKVLFSQDGFGQHLATSRLWIDENPRDVVAREEAKYYANILLPFSPLVNKTLAKLAELDLDIDVLAPDHGPLFRRDEDIEWVLGRYAEWAEMAPTRKALVVYDTMWQSDTVMAKAVAEGLAEGGAETVKVLSMAGSHRSDVATEILAAGALVVGSPTINNQIFPTMADVMTYLAGLKRRNLVGAAFGSYGWSGEAPGKLADWLEEMNVELVAEPLKVTYRPTDDDLAACRDLGRTVGEALAERAQS